MGEVVQCRGWGICLITRIFEGQYKNMWIWVIGKNLEGLHHGLCICSKEIENHCYRGTLVWDIAAMETTKSKWHQVTQGRKVHVIYTCREQTHNCTICLATYRNISSNCNSLSYTAYARHMLGCVRRLL